MLFESMPVYIAEHMPVLVAIIALMLAILSTGQVIMLRRRLAGLRRELLVFANASQEMGAWLQNMDRSGISAVSGVSASSSRSTKSAESDSSSHSNEHNRDAALNAAERDVVYLLERAETKAS